MKPPQVHAPNAVAPAIKMLTDFLESKIAKGEKFEVGQSIQCSWMWFKVGEDEKGETVVLAPRAGTMPMDYVPDISDALNLVLTQRYVCDSFGVGCGWCNALQAATVVKDLAECRDVFMNRTDSEQGRSSGWFFGGSDSKLDVNLPENLELKSLWELSCHFPIARDFFLLPQGWQVALREQPVVLNDSERTTPRSGSYYAEKYRS
jgi:hypothetical protein